MRRRRGVTLIELMVVMVIILLISAVALPTVVSSYRDLGLKQSAQTLHSAFKLATDYVQSSNDKAIVGLRLIPSTNFPQKRTGFDDNGTANDPTDDVYGPIDPLDNLVYDRIVTLTQPPDYSTGLVSHRSDQIPPAFFAMFKPGRHPLILEDAVFDGVSYTDDKNTPDPADDVIYPDGHVNEPLTWFWNARVGDVIEVLGHKFTICGPMVMGPDNGNTECFVNVGRPGTTSPLVRTFANVDNNGVPITRPVEFLFLVNNTDDPFVPLGKTDGFVDGGFDGIDNNLNGLIDEHSSDPNDPDEWEMETFPPILKADFVGYKYNIVRRPIANKTPSFQLPYGYVIDATNWQQLPTLYNLSDTTTNWVDRFGVIHPNADGRDIWDYSGIRSRLPVNHLTGEVDVIFRKDGSAYTSTMYSGPPQTPYGADDLRFWITDVANVLPLPRPGDTLPDARFNPKGSAYLVSFNVKTGRVVVGDADPLDVHGSFMSHNAP